MLAPVVAGVIIVLDAVRRFCGHADVGGTALATYKLGAELVYFTFAVFLFPSQFSQLPYMVEGFWIYYCRVALLNPDILPDEGSGIF